MTGTEERGGKKGGGEPWVSGVILCFISEKL